MLVEQDSDLFTRIVGRYLRVDDVTIGSERQSYLVRYRGELLGDSAEAYDGLAAALGPYDVTPLFRKEKDQAVVLLMKGKLNPQPSNPWVNLVLFSLTVVSVLYAGALFSYSGPAPTSPTESFLLPLRYLADGVPFGVSMLAILLAHEFGHYLVARYHKTYVTLPYFIPLPISPLGTMGAAILMKEPPKNRRILLDIGLAGPVAGLVVAIPVLLLGLSLSKVESLPVSMAGNFQVEGNSILYLLAKYLVFQQWLPAPADYGGLSPLVYWVRYFFTGLPAPLGGMDVIIHPVAWAGWAGLLVTSLNLVPVGQLDGGQITNAIFGRKAQLLWPFVIIALVLMGFFWSGWWLWAGLVFLFGRMIASPLDEITTLNPGRKWLAALGLVLFFLVFIPVPLQIF